jgi:adenylate cyclase
MRSFTDIQAFQEMNLLVSFCDIRGFYNFCQGKSHLEITKFLDEFYELVGDIIEGAGGQILKFLGDAALIIFAEEDVSRGVIALKKLQDESDAWLKARNTSCRNIIKAHFGPVSGGLVGTRHNKQFDIFGMTVNTAFKIPSYGLAITPQVFRQLDTDTRQLFKKHTPPMRYIPLDEAHQD